MREENESARLYRLRLEESFIKRSPSRSALGTRSLSSTHPATSFFGRLELELLRPEPVVMQNRRVLEVPMPVHLQNRRVLEVPSVKRFTQSIISRRRRISTQVPWTVIGALVLGKVLSWGWFAIFRDPHLRCGNLIPTPPWPVTYHSKM